MQDGGPVLQPLTARVHDTHTMPPFIALSARQRKSIPPLGKLGQGDRLEILIRRKSGEEQVIGLPQAAAALLEYVLEHLLRGERVAVLTEDEELSVEDAAEILGISRALVVHRMDTGDLPLRYVGRQRRARLKDVLALKSKLDAQQGAMRALAEDAEELRERHGA